MNKVRLGDTCEILNGYAFKSENYVTEGIRVIRIANVQKGYIEDKEPQYYPINCEEDIAKYSLFENDLLISLTGNVGRVALLPKEMLPAALNQRVACLRMNTKSDISKDFLFHYLNSDKFENDCITSSKGVAQKNMSTEWLKKYEIPVFSQEKQRQISTLLSLNNSLIEKEKLQLQKSRFVEMFGDPILNPKGWEMTTIGEIVTEVKYGTSRPAIDGGKYAYLRMNNLTYDGYLDLADLKRIDIPDSEIEKCIVRKGDVLFNRTNSIELVGKTCVFDKDEDMIIAGYIIRVRLKPVMLPLIMSYFMNTDALKKKLRSMAKGAVNQANINAQELKAIKIYLPPTDLQQQFAAFVAQIDKSKYCLVGEQILGKAEMLIKILKQEYFG